MGCGDFKKRPVTFHFSGREIRGDKNDELSLRRNTVRDKDNESENDGRSRDQPEARHT